MTIEARCSGTVRDTSDPGGVTTSTPVSTKRATSGCDARVAKADGHRTGYN